MALVRLDRRRYIDAVLDLYRRAPETTGPLRRADRQLAGDLHDRGVPLGVVRAALILAVARRAFRAAAAPPLAPIATLHYIRPVIDELIANPPEPAYLRYLCGRLAVVAPAFVTDVDVHQLP